MENVKELNEVKTVYFPMEKATTITGNVSDLPKDIVPFSWGVPENHQKDPLYDFCRKK